MKRASTQSDQCMNQGPTKAPLRGPLRMVGTVDERRRRYFKKDDGRQSEMVVLAIRGENRRVEEITIFDPGANELPVVGEVVDLPIYVTRDGRLRLATQAGELF